MSHKEDETSTVCDSGGYQTDFKRTIFWWSVIQKRVIKLGAECDFFQELHIVIK